MPVTSSASWGAKILAKVLTSEGALGFTGCAMACAAGSFAFYMNTHGPAGGLGGGTHYFTVFAQLNPRTRAERATHGEPPPAPVVAMAEEIDPVVTGSIPEKASKDARLVRVPPPRMAPPDDKPILANVLLRQIDGDTALVEMNDNLGVYKIGDMIPGAGRLVAMTHQGGRPALETSRGLIVEAR